MFTDSRSLLRLCLPLENASPLRSPSQNGSFRNCPKKTRLSSCIALIANHIGLIKNLTDKDKHRMWIHAEASWLLQRFQRLQRAFFAHRLAPLSSFNAKFNAKEISCPAELYRNKLTNGFVACQTIISWLDKFANYCTSAHYNRGWKRIDPSMGYKQRDNYADDDTNIRDMRREAAWSSVCFLANREFEFEANDSTRHTYRRPT